MTAGVGRQRLLCGQAVIRGLQPAGPGRWKNGWSYHPDNGKTYRPTARPSAADTMIARLALGIPLFGETWTLRRVPLLESEGRYPARLSRQRHRRLQPPRRPVR